MNGEHKITSSHQERAALVYLFSELRDNVAVQEAVQPQRRTAAMSGKSNLAGP